MALEQYKTQILLLHSQQSTLDTLGAGFGEKYSVHYATSGSEALHTLGETPIHVLVSAQDLPGMSGLEALREAKKRSPDTIGILLAGSDRDDGLEALVGDKEVFQIVRGAVSPDALLTIIEAATKRVRMLTLAESANDTAANPDEPAGEHIVMETAENGSTIISDGTGKMPVLRPEKIQVVPDAGGREVDVLVLTKDDEFLQTIRNSSRGMHNVHHASTGTQAQDIVRKYKVGVLVTDAAIAGAKIELLTQALRAAVPRLVAVVAGRRDDGDLLMDLINRGHVYRFLLKPVSPGRARLAIEASVKHHLEGPDAVFKGKPPAAGARAPVATPAAPVVTGVPPTPEPAPASQGAGNADVTTAPQPASKPDPGILQAERPSAPPDLASDGKDDQAAPMPEPSMDDGARGTSSTRLPMIGAAVAALVVAAVSLWYFTIGDSGDAARTPADRTQAVDVAPADDDTATSRTPAVTESDVPVRTPQQLANPVATPEPAAPPEWMRLLDDARYARDAGKIVTPTDQNAVQLYVAARAAAPDNAVIGEELSALVAQVLTMAETALLEKRAADAATALELIAVADPAQPRLAFMNAQLLQLRLQIALSDARSAIREAHFEDARRLLGEARTYAGADVSEVEQVEKDLTAARSAQRLDEVLALASARLAEDRLVAPANDNARYFYELALTNDPGNTGAKQGLIAVASKLVLRARAAIDIGDLADAGAILDDARALNADSSQVEAVAAALVAAEATAAEAERQAEIARQEAAARTEAERLAELQRASARTATLSTAGANTAGNDDTDSPAAGNAPVRGTAVPASQAAANAGNATENDDADGGPLNEQPVAVSRLTRINYVAPRYPRSAQRRSLSGWVDLSFIVSTGGAVTGVQVMDSAPGSIFDDAATDAVRQWRFEPVIENGVAVRKRVAVRMSFSLE